MSIDISDPTLKLWMRINLAKHMLSMERASELKPMQISPIQATTLIAIKAARNPVNMAQLSYWLGCSPPTTTRLLDRMEKAGLLERKRDGKNRKEVNVHLTNMGESVFEKVVHSQAVRDAFQVLDPNEQAQLLASLEKVARHMYSSNFSTLPKTR
ncbi:MAG: MarR family transcriptional regulator [Dehalococcoidia bacterium]|nr:MarR family transcriptional regulator [Dehalococcoidia bacterium]